MTQRAGPTVAAFSPTMSISTLSSPASESTTASETARDLTDLYLILIHQSPEVCSNCHQRIRDREQHDTNTLGTGNRPTETLERAGEGILGYTSYPKDEYGVICDYQPRTYCDSCGHPDGRARDTASSKSEMLASVRPLVKRLDEAGVPVDDELLFKTTSHLRSKEDLHGSETEIWRAAVAVAAKHARPRDCVRCTYGRL